MTPFANAPKRLSSVGSPCFVYSGSINAYILRTHPHSCSVSFTPCPSLSQCNNMNHQPPWNFRVISGDKETVQSSRNENSFDFPESRVTKPNSRLQTPGFLDTVTSVKDDFTEFYGDLMDVQPSAANTCIVSELETSCEHDMGQSSGTMKKSNEMDLQKCQSDIGTKISEEMEREPDNRPKRTRSVEVHNQSERRRRDRINKSLKTLQELVPNCNKSNRASVLDDAVNYVKALRFQVEIMSAQGGGIFSAPFVSPSGYQSTQVPRFAPYVPISPKFTMGIGSGSGRVSIRCSVGHPMISATSASLHPSLTAGVGLPLIPASRNLAVPQMQMPFTPSQQLRPSVDSTAMLSNFVPGYSPAYNFSNNTRHFH